MTKTERFLDLYKTLEQIAITEYDLPADGTSVSRLEKMKEFKPLASELRYCREVRSLLQHKPQINGEYAVTPSSGMITLLETVIGKIREPKRCIDVCTPISEILSADPDDSLLPVMKQMAGRGISGVPILHNGRAVGILSENAILRYQAKSGELAGEKTLVRDLETFTSLSAVGKKYQFMKASDPSSAAISLITSRFRKGERLAMILLTEDGTKNDRLLGILTPWDVMGNE